MTGPAKQVRTGNSGRWARGTSGNPRGRKPAGLASVEKLRDALVSDLPKILETVVEAAKGGDLQAARIILDKVLPNLRPIEPPAILGPLPSSLSEAGVSVLAAMSQGKLNPSQAAALITAIAAQARLVEVDEIRQRLLALEQANTLDGVLKVP